jgi:hypothetical protein
MKTILKMEELAMFALAYFYFLQLNFAGWWFWALLLTPDVGMLGYLVNSRVGAVSYNLFHHKGLAILVGGLGYLLHNEVIVLAGVILFAHAAFDRIMGYGLKYAQGFNYTHLGEIGQKKV